MGPSLQFDGLSADNHEPILMGRLPNGRPSRGIPLLILFTCRQRWSCSIGMFALG